MAKQPIKDYKKLKEIWYAKLKKSGFEDIEQSDGKLKEWSTRWVRKGFSPIRNQSLESYFHMATRFLNEYPFESELHKIVWEYHANGLSVREIAGTLGKTKVIKRTGAWVHKFVIKPLREEMKRLYMHE